jgi:flagellin-like hook-associated protein FlgL
LEGKEYPSYFTAMLQDFSRLMGKRRMQLSGLLQGKELLHNRYFETFSGKIFRLLSGQYDLLQDVMNVVLEEVVTGTVDFDVVIYATEEESKNQTSSAPGVSTGGGAAATRVSALEDAADSDIEGAYMAIDKAEWTKERRILVSKIGLNETKLAEYLSKNSYLTQSVADKLYAAKSAIEELQNDVADAVDAAEAAQTAASNASSKVNSLSSTISTLQTRVNSLSNTVSDLEDLVNAFDDRISALEDLWYYDASNNAVRTTYNVIGNKQGTFGQ